MYGFLHEHTFSLLLGKYQEWDCGLCGNDMFIRNCQVPFEVAALFSFPPAAQEFQLLSILTSTYWCQVFVLCRILLLLLLDSKMCDVVTHGSFHLRFPNK